jgi:predicted NBD/HSP70 family sugar kinase
VSRRARAARDGVVEQASASARPVLLRQLNARTVLEMIRSRGPVSRAEIARAAGISKPTVSLALRVLLDAGLVREADRGGADGPTYGAIFFEADPDAAAALAVDIGARYLRVALADVAGAVRAREDVETADASADRVLAMIPDVAQRLLARAEVGTARLAGATVGVPGVVEPLTGSVTLAENVPGLEGTRVAERLREQLAVPVHVVNDVNLAAIGERDAGAGRGVENFVLVSVGTGLGAGVVIGGELRPGSHGAAGELDLLRPAASGSDPSAPAIRAYAAELDAAHPGADHPRDTVEIFARARAGDTWALGICTEVARRICAHIVPIAAIVDPELVLLGGGIGSNGDLLLPHVREMLAEALPYPPAVQTSQLGGDAVLTGALALAVADAREVSLSRIATPA